jgi:calcineurin-like phosphoesterase family protein
VPEMDYAMIDRWNAVVGDEDTVIHNGDFQFYKKDTGIFSCLKGHKILVKGNHDHSVTRNMGWASIHDVLEITHNDKKVVFCHYPFETWNNAFHGSIHLFGHVHTTYVSEIKNRHNICAEYINYTPQNLDRYTKGVTI